MIFMPNYLNIQTRIFRDVRTLDSDSCRSVRYCFECFYFDENNNDVFDFYLIGNSGTRPSTSKSMNQMPPFIKFLMRSKAH